MVSWGDLKARWNLNPVALTDPDTADNYDIANAIITFQAAAMAITDSLAAKSKEFEKASSLLSEYREAVILAYVAAMQGNSDEVVKLLTKVVNK